MLEAHRPRQAGSLKKRIVITLTTLLVLVSVLDAAASFWLSRRHIDDLMDSHLQGAAVWLAAGKVGALGTDGPPQHSVDGFVGQVWKRDISTPTDNTDDSVLFDRNAPAGFSEESVDGQIYRLYTLRHDDGALTYQVGQPLAYREQTAMHSALESLVPGLIRIPLVWLAIVLLVRASLAPLERARADVEALGVARLKPLDVLQMPDEVRPFADSINRMIARLEAGIDAEKRFIADAAHEMRTPLAALQLRVDNLRNAPDTAARAERERELSNAVARNAAMVHQLLGLARADAQVDSATLESVDMRGMFQGLLADMLPIAVRRSIDLGFKRFEPARVAAREEDLSIAVSNLLQNALRYTPEGGCVDIDLFQQVAPDGQAVEVIVRVTDTGPGIPQASLERVFDRFFRLNQGVVDGSGLGLSIVRTVVAKYGGKVVLANRDDGTSGLVATLALPGVPCADSSGGRPDQRDTMEWS